MTAANDSHRLANESANEIDLRSDTVTKPTAAMRQAMAQAEVGDAVIDVDPTVDRLERMTAELLGKEAAVFVPSGSMANQIALRVHCPTGTQFLCEADCHIFHYEQGAFASLSGLIPRLIPSDGGTLTEAQLSMGHFVAEDDHHPATRLLALENTHNRMGGRVIDQRHVVSVCRWASERSIATHLDGARLWNAAVARETDVESLARPFDSVSVCFSKGLGAPVGSALAGTQAFVAQARRARKLFGGAMRQAGIIAAGAIHALEHHRRRLADDHEHAQMLAAAIERCQAFRLRDRRVDTNILMFETPPGQAGQCVDRLARRGLRCFPINPDCIRLVTHLGVSRDDVRRGCEILEQTAEDLSGVVRT